MTAIALHLTALTCDGCGARFYPPDAQDATSARLQAAQAGWKYASWVARSKGQRGGSGRKVFDACPNCDLPAVTS